MAVPVRFILKEDLQHQQKKCGNRKGLERNHVGWGDDVGRSASGTLHAQKLQLNQNQKQAIRDFKRWLCISLWEWVIRQNRSVVGVMDMEDIASAIRIGTDELSPVGDTPMKPVCDNRLVVLAICAGLN